MRSIFGANRGRLLEQGEGEEGYGGKGLGEVTKEMDQVNYSSRPDLGI